VNERPPDELGAVPGRDSDASGKAAARYGRRALMLGASTTYTREAKSTASAMQPGDTVIVQGTTGKNGTVVATSVADTAAGVSVAG